MTEPPRRLPPTQEERLRVVTRRMAPGSNDGQTRYARPIAHNAHAGTHQGGGMVGSAYYVDPNTYSAVTKTINPTDLMQAYGDASNIAYHFNGTDGGLLLAGPGWYQAAAQAAINATTAGGSAFLQINVASAQPTNMRLPSVLAAYPPSSYLLFSGVCTPVFYAPQGAFVTVSVWGNNGGNIGNAGIYAVQFPD